MDFECYFCGKTFNYIEPVDIEDEQKHKYHVCIDCYIKGIDVILEGQYSELINRSVRRGRWIECCNELDKKCSRCNKEYGTIYENESFCPNCGARMEGIL